jgi:hypothetical protein
VVKLAVLAIVAAGSGTARADTEQAVSAGIGYATFSVPGKAMGNMSPPTLSPDLGGALTLAYERALGSDVQLRGELTTGLFHGGADTTVKGQGDTSYALLVDAGITYRFDVFQCVPYAFAGLGGVLSGGGPIDRGADFVLVVGGGLDKLLGRRRSFGGEVRVASFGGDITVVTLGVRGTVRWGFF